MSRGILNEKKLVTPLWIYGELKRLQWICVECSVPLTSAKAKYQWSLIDSIMIWDIQSKTARSLVYTATMENTEYLFYYTIHKESFVLCTVVMTVIRVQALSKFIFDDA